MMSAGAEGTKGEDRSSVEKTRRARGEGSRPARTPGDGVSGARDGGLGPRGSMPSDTMDMNVTEPIHRAV